MTYDFHSNDENYNISLISRVTHQTNYVFVCADRLCDLIFVTNDIYNATFPKHTVLCEDTRWFMTRPARCPAETHALIIMFITVITGRPRARWGYIIASSWFWPMTVRQAAMIRWSNDSNAFFSRREESFMVLWRFLRSESLHVLILKW